MSAGLITVTGLSLTPRLGPFRRGELLLGSEVCLTSSLRVLLLTLAAPMFVLPLPILGAVA